jgi:hypothetical protein
MAGTIVATTQARPGRGRGVVRVDLALTCAAGAISAQSIGSFFGRLVGIFYEPTAGAGATMTATADVLLTDALTGAPIISDLAFGTARYERPSMPIQDATGTLVTAAATATDTNRDIFVAGKLNLAIANATTTDTGYLGLVFEEGV